MLFVAAVAAVGISCQRQDYLMPDPDALPPVVESLVTAGETLVYGDSLACEFTVSDASAISHAELELVVDNAVRYSKLWAGHNATSMTLRDTVSIPFQSMCVNTSGIIRVSVMNKEMKETEYTREIQVRRPGFVSIRFVPDDAGLQAVEMEDDGSDVYSASGLSFDNGVTGFIHGSVDGQEDDVIWGFDQTAGICMIGAETPVTLCDSESIEMKVSEIVFDAVSFEITPLEKERSVQGVALLPYKVSPSDAENVSNTFRTVSPVHLEQGSEVALELIDLEEVMFDPDWFEVSGDCLVYTGPTGDVNLYLNTLWNFVFVEHESWPFVSQMAYPETLFINGWGVACPELWFYNPNWDFSKALSMRQTGNDGGEYTYRMTVAASVDANFKFYTGSDWGYEIAPTGITYEGDALEAREESGKPGNYNIYFKSGQEFKSCVIALEVTAGGTATVLKSEILRTSDKDK